MRTIHTRIRTAGIAIGTAFVLVRREKEVAHGVETSDPAAEAARFDDALAQAQNELRTLAADNDIFGAHLEMAGDPMLYEQVTAHIVGRKLPAELALAEACEEVCSMLATLDDEYLRARADDVRDVCSRIDRVLRGKIQENPFAGLPPGTIVVADELTPSDTALMDFSRIAGLVTARGSATSHVCIIARSKGIAVMVGVAECLLEIKSGNILIVNGEHGELIVDPNPETIRKYSAYTQTRQNSCGGIKNAMHMPATTRSGHQISVMGNAGSVDDVRQALDSGADGIGLFRSEFLYMQSRNGFPGEEQQLAAYRAATELCRERPLVVRTLDIGGDKTLPYMNLDAEENPFLGWRGIRISLAMHDVFRTQLRALLRASVFGNLQIMFPMITSVGELQQAKNVVKDCIEELDAENIAYNPHIRLGVMIETPAAVMVADLLAAEADFFSIGTNDLTQYVMAADRGNPRVAHLYDPYDTAVLRSIERVLEAAHVAGIEAGLCGELAADLHATSWLLGAGLCKFSVSAPVIGALKEQIRTFSISEGRDNLRAIPREKDCCQNEPSNK